MQFGKLEFMRHASTERHEQRDRSQIYVEIYRQLYGVTRLCDVAFSSLNVTDRGFLGAVESSEEI